MYYDDVTYYQWQEVKMERTKNRIAAEDPVPSPVARPAV